VNGVTADRLHRLGTGLDAVHRRIDRACARLGRSPDEVTVIVVTKTYPAQDVLALAELGVREVGENREQEASSKAADCAGADLRWHFVGQVQTNKARRLARFIDVVHSVDRVRLVRALGAGAQESGRGLGCLVQVRLDDAAGRGGAVPGDVPGIAEAVAEQEGLELAGVMAVAPWGQPARPAFARLARVHEQVLRDHPRARMMSAGMSGDLEDALAEGATHLRVGSAILGPRRTLGYRPDGG
jgi:pyridoxal phosphate enzyme (YggS family)